MPAPIASSPPAPSDDIAAYLSTDEFDFIDFGCSKGGSLSFGKSRLGGKRGLGVDIAPAKVQQARAAGFDACLADVRKLSMHPGKVQFVTMIDFLEHVPSISDAARCVEAACTVASKFVFIRQPWFDSDGYLCSLGFKLYWSDWTGHPNAMTSLEFHRVMNRLPKVKRWRLYGRRPIRNSIDPAVHPLASPADQHEWVSGQHPPKPEVTFTQPVFSQIGCIAILQDNPDLLAELERRAKWDRMLFDSKNPAQAPASH